MGFASGPWNARGGHDICAGIETGARTDDETSGHVSTDQSGVASVFAVRIQHSGVWYQGRDEETT